jgi:hypothetical protein
MRERIASPSLPWAEHSASDVSRVEASYGRWRGLQGMEASRGHRSTAAWKICTEAKVAGVAGPRIWRQGCVAAI